MTLPLTDPILVFTVLILGMLLGPILAERLRVPDLVVLLIVGAVIGPNGLGILARDSAVTLFGSVGLLYIMFLAGLEIDLHRFAHTKQRSILFGLLTFIIPQSLGTIVGRYLLGFDWQASILLASMFASHTLLAYPIASRLGIARSEPVTVSVGATIITDTLALFVLALIADSARGQSLGPTFWAGVAVWATVLFVLTWWGIPKVTRWFFQNVTEAGGTQFLFVLGMLCAVSYFSHLAKMEPIIGAFLVGAAFNRLIPERSVLRSRVVFVGNTLFIPFFLISVGMLVDPKALVADPHGWLVVITMVVMVIATKYAAAWLSGALLGYDHDARQVMFGLTVVQAAATLAAVLVGYSLGIFEESVLNGSIAMILTTGLLGAWCVDRYGRRLASRAVPGERRGKIEQRLLIPVVNPAFAERLLDLAFMLRDPSVPGAINPITIVRDERHIDEPMDRAEKLMEVCLNHAASANIPVDPFLRVDLNTADGIARAAKELQSTEVLVGWGGKQAVRTRIFGTVMEKLLNVCPPRLFFCRLVRPLNTTKRLYLPLFPLAERREDLPLLLENAKFLCRQIGAELRVYLTGADVQEVRKLVEAARPSCPLTLVETASQAETRARLFEALGPDDMVLFPAERRSGVFWTPMLDSLPDMLVSRFPENNLLVAYPALESNGGTLVGAGERTPGFALYATEIGPAADLEEALRTMASTAFVHHNGVEGDVHRLLMESAATCPMELTSGAVLLHAHCEGLERPTVIVGRGGGPWIFQSMAAPAGILVALLSPRDQDADGHLRSLSELARRFHDPEFSAQVGNARSAQEIMKMIALG
jgi:Kef-type K+ transport system membrane component KefB/mannitol/fructose-specific phosphotransferase system IIA component (Ntr-type)